MSKRQDEIRRFLLHFRILYAKINRFDQMQNQIDGIQGQINELQNRVEEISDRQLVFESEYGTKIDAIFDAVTMELDKNLEKSEKIRTLEKRADRHDAVMLGYEKRISKLELNR